MTRGKGVDESISWRDQNEIDKGPNPKTFEIDKITNFFIIYNTTHKFSFSYTFAPKI